MNDGFVDLLADRAALLRMLQEMGLARDGEPIRSDLLPGGVSSNVFRVDLERGPACVKQALPQLKVEKEWFAPTNRVLAEIDWLTTAQTIVPDHVPRLLGADRARGAFVMEFLCGLVNWKSELLAGKVDVWIGEQVAEVLARVHGSTACDAVIAQRFRHDGNFFALRLEPYLIEAARVHPDLSRELVALVHTTQTTRLALVHGDVSPKNVLIGVDGPILLDAECACYGDPAFDLAFLLNHVLLKAAHRPQSAKVFCILYERIVSAYLAMVRWEPREAIEGRCAKLLPGLLLARIDGKSPVEYLSETARASVRSASRELLAAPPGSLAELLARWRVASPSLGAALSQ